ncbi:MAG TPA: hypothetical protein VGL34_25235 [Steroidobacteraceae bacterium]|jgi:hypothetical protein
MSVSGGIVDDFQALKRKYMKLEQCSVAGPVMQCHLEGCQWRDKDATIKRLTAKCERLEKTIKDMRSAVLAVSETPGEPK